MVSETGRAPFLNFWEKAVADLYGKAVSLEQLDGEYDLNFRAVTDGGDRAILKVMRPDCKDSFVDMLCRALEHISNLAPDFPTPKVIHTATGSLYSEYRDENGDIRLVWMLSHLAGVPYGIFKPQESGLISDLGRRIGIMDSLLASFDHPGLDRDMKWDLTAADWITTQTCVVDDPARQKIVEAIATKFEAVLKPALKKLPKIAIHNDVNDYNVLVENFSDQTAVVSGLIDFGDMLRAPRICDLAIAGAYIVLDQPKPLQALAALVAGYHRENPLSEQELSLLYPLVLTRLAVSVINSTIMAREKPDDPYVLISQAPAWRFLERSVTISEAEALARLRIACELPITAASEKIVAWLDANRGRFTSVLGQDIAAWPTASLSVAGSTMPRNPLDLTEQEAVVLTGAEKSDTLAIGFYAEPRLIYTGEGFHGGPYEADDRRSIHIGVDLFAPAGTPVHAPLDGTVRAVSNSPDRFDYGGVVILGHETPDGDTFQTLYGHLDPAVTDKLTVGDRIAAGTVFAALGAQTENGGWQPHLHIQLSIMSENSDAIWPGVANPDDCEYALAAFPNPASLLNLPDDRLSYQPLPEQDIACYRREHFAANLKLSYRRPCLFLRGWRHFLFDEMGRCYLDAYNNVPHVGHAHPRLQQIACEQLGRLNSNTRYLHPAQTAFAEKLLSKVSDRYDVCFFVNSGSEANELALRLARAASGGKDMITPDHGYHGMTTGAIDISAYKFNKPNGVGQADWVHLVSVPDPYRGAPKTSEDFASEIDTAIAAVQARGGKLAGFIAETFPSVGGQIIPPPGYLKSVYEKIRAAGGICIADEVQTGLGRLGSHYWAYEIQAAEPDVIVLGKPLGNGHPLGAVITTRAIADAFANGIEYFSTFGGSTLSCMIGREVLQIVDDEGLQDNARNVGGNLLQGLAALMDKHHVVGDVRGHGLFIGFDLVRNREIREPATDIASYLVNRLRDCRILVGTEGPADNILKIRPPLTIDSVNAGMIIDRIDSILGETFCAV